MISTLGRQYGHKVKTVDDLCRAIGPRPRRPELPPA